MAIETSPDTDDLIGDTDVPESSTISSPFRAYLNYLRTVESLTAAQQIALVEMMRDPDEPETSRQWAATRLWLDTCKFVLYVRMKLRRSMPFVRLDDMDAVQEGNLAAGRALSRWEPTRGTLTTWLFPHVRGALLSYAGKEATVDQRAVSLDAVMGSEIGSDTIEQGFEEEPVTLSEILQYDHHVFDDPETITEYGQVRRLLIEEHGPEWGNLAADFLIGDTNIRELAAKYGISVPTVYNRMRKMGF